MSKPKKPKKTPHCDAVGLDIKNFYRSLAAVVLDLKPEKVSGLQIQIVSQIAMHLYYMKKHITKAQFKTVVKADYELLHGPMAKKLDKAVTEFFSTKDFT